MKILLLAFLACAAVVNAHACQLNNAETKKVSDTISVFYKVTPQQIPLNQFFSIDILFCLSDQNHSIEQLKVDATMPLHQHGMNYFPSVEKRQTNQFVIKDLLFHMPGLWEIEFKSTSDNKPFHFTIEQTL